MCLHFLNNKFISRQLKLSDDKMIFGVCASIAEFCGWDTKMTRLITVILALVGTIGIWAYLVIAFVMYLLNK